MAKKTRGSDNTRKKKVGVISSNVTLVNVGAIRTQGVLNKRATVGRLFIIYELC